jgi:RNA polymerase sigma factor (sigma-70 family)
MAIGGMSVCPQAIRILFEVGTFGGLSDGQLLEQFATRRDEIGESAFAALMARHGPMVLSVCGGLLGDAHDAEEAFQATFLILAKKSRSIRDSELLGNWLFGVARRTAQKAKARRARWRGRVESEGTMSSIAVVSGLAELESVQREETVALHEEVERLPPNLRTPIVLCYLEGLTHDEAARRLRWPTGTVCSRMARARVLLRSRLTRRGVAYAALAAALEAPRAATAEVPQSLADTTAQAATQLASGAVSELVSMPVASLMNAVLKAMFMSQLKRGVATVFAAGCIAVGAGIIAAGASQLAPLSTRGDAATARGADRPTVEGDRARPGTEPAGDPEQTMALNGVVLDPAGKPVARAQIAVFGFPRRTRRAGDHSNPHQVIGTATADELGHFRIMLTRISSAQFLDIDVVAGAAGFGMGWQPLDPDATQFEVEVRLRPEEVVRGRLVDVQGQPAARVAVSVVQLWAQSDFRPSGVGFWNAPSTLPPWPATAKTDSGGRFVLRGVGREVRVELQVRDDRFACQKLSVGPAGSGEQDGKVFVLTPAHIIDGKVTYGDTNVPVSHARLAAQGGHYISDEADAEGRFRLNPYADAPYKSLTTGEPLFSVYAYAPDGQPYLGLEKELTWTNGSVRQTLNFALPRGVLVRGKVTDASSGKSIDACRILYAPLKVEKLDSSLTVLTGEWSAVVSREDGSYAIPVPPGTGHLIVTGASPEYILSEFGSQILDGRPGGLRKYAQAVVPITARKESQPVDIGISLRKGATVRGRVLNPEGSPVADGAVITRFNVSAQAHRWGGRLIPVRDGRFVISGLEPDRAYRMLVHDAKHRYGTTIELSANANTNEPVTIRLAPSGSARVRLVNSAGKPITKYRVAIQIVMTPGRFQCDFDASVRGEDLAADAGPATDNGNNLGGTPTDAKGLTTFSGLIPGATYRVLTTERENISIDSEVLTDFQIKGGEVLDLPAITINGNNAAD